jgi:hypothetical protein
LIAIDHHVGRLIETRFSAPISEEEITGFAQGR